ncbi:hypothetical protein ACFYN0_03625 [Streptomyces sp. NPDC006704]|uniref:hypothetical protein n=1 Tax=Streptomyces sp. NPDC006704 TaxID=3364760 RepID=UPI0036C7DECA
MAALSDERKVPIGSFVFTDADTKERGMGSAAFAPASPVPAASLASGPHGRADVLPE